MSSSVWKRKALLRRVEQRAASRGRSLSGGNAQPTDKSVPSPGHHHLFGIVLGAILALVAGILSEDYQASRRLSAETVTMRRMEQKEAVDALLDVVHRVDAVLALSRAGVVAAADTSKPFEVSMHEPQVNAAVSNWEVNELVARVKFNAYFGFEGDNAMERFGRLVDQAQLTFHRAVDSRDMYATARREASRAVTPSLASELRAVQATNYQLLISSDSLSGMLREGAFALSQVLVSAVRSRRTGSFDPLGYFSFTPLKEAKLIREMDEEASQNDSGQRPVDSKVQVRLRP